MRHCPNPGCASLREHGLVAEFASEVERCSECRTPLEPGPAPPAETELVWADLVRAATFSELHAAHAAQSLLRSEGIDSFLANAFTSGAGWPYGAVAGGVQLHVRPVDLRAAAELLAAPLAEGADRAFEASVSLDEACPRCGAADPEPVVKPRRWLALLGTLFGFSPPAAAASGLRCRVCRLDYYA